MCKNLHLKEKSKRVDMKKKKFAQIIWATTITRHRQIGNGGGGNSSNDHNVDLPHIFVNVFNAYVERAVDAIVYKLNGG